MSIKLSTNGARGFVLLPVLLILAVIGAIALISNQKGVVGAKQAASQLTEEQARYSAEAGIAIATRELEQDVDCTAYNISSSGSFNGVNYTSALSATSGSPVTLTITADQGSSSRNFSQQVTMYQESEILLDANADSYVFEDLEDDKYGSATTLHVHGRISYFKRSLLSFDLSGLSLTGSQILSSQLELYLVSSPENDKEDITVQYLENEWVESEVTWKKRKKKKDWSPEGGDYNATEVTRTEVDKNFPGLYSWDISSLTKNWLDTVTTNYGVILRATTFWKNNKEFASKEYTTDISKRPKLRIAYKCECGASCP